MIPRLDWRRLGRRLEHNLLLRVFSVIFAIGLWAFVNLGARDAEKTLTVPLELRNVSSQLVVTSPMVDSIDVRVRGPRTLLGSIDGMRQRVQLDLGSVRPGTTSFKIDSEMLSLPRGVRVTRVSPVQVTLNVERIVSRSLPVTVKVGGPVPNGYRLAESEVRPVLVEVTGPTSQVEALKSISTAPIALRPALAVFEQSVDLVRPGELVRLAPERVVVHGRLEEEVGSKELREITVEVRGAAGRYRLQPSRADVTLRGPRRILQELSSQTTKLYVDAAGLGPGAHRRKIAAAIPEGVEVAEVRPSEARIEILGATPAAKRR